MNVHKSFIKLVDSLKDAEANLERVRKEYADEPELLQFYEPSAKFLVDCASKQLKELTYSYMVDANVYDADVIIKLKGEGFEEGRAPLGAVGAFIKNLTSANQHAVILFEKIKYEGKRITRRIKELADLDLIATAPGSLQLVLRRPPAERYVMHGEEKQDQMSEESYLLNAVESARENAERAVEGIKLLSRAIVAANDEDEYKELYAEVKEPKDMLKLLYYAREIAPPQSSEINEVVITSVFVKNEKLKTVSLNSETRQKILERSKLLIKEGYHITGGGIVREVDFDKMSFRMNSLNTGSETFDVIECKASKKYFNEHNLEGIGNKAIKLSGLLIYTTKGEPDYIKVDDITVV